MARQQIPGFYLWIDLGRRIRLGALRTLKITLLTYRNPETGTANYFGKAESSMQQLKTNINLLPRSASKKQRIYDRNWAKLQQLADQCSLVKWPYKTTTSHSGCVFSRAVSTVNILLLARRETQLPYIEKKSQWN